ncbi:hypothetical protein SCLCIDRAFT_1221387 [Scleroderma citrinum Foug A]|uniref:Uncharacterized protein n=1 Tax=Scleroderma citrinum Foug A TaxID=1036808 RepID=A0A0C3DFF8_9AGAM|nr:hypothetical protein SCLCIDRAFT_1221387 [Scleroderma citrinum Foug A]
MGWWRAGVTGHYKCARTVIDITLHPNEPEAGEQATYILEKLERAQAVALEGLQDSVISIEPTTISLQTKFTKEGEGDPYAMIADIT